jgi:DNA-binding transcriptional ArsR family regulator
MSEITAHTEYEAGIAPAAALMADPARAAMLLALLDGRPLAASELSRLAAVSPPTASAHLAKLLDGGLVTVVRQGRHRYYRLAGHQVAEAIEALSQIARPAPVRSLRQSRRAAALAEARTCYDHLAGRLGVALTEALVARNHIALSEDGGMVTPSGEDLFRSFGFEVRSKSPSRRPFCRPCLDWSERRPHLAGALGAAIAARCFELDWIARIRDTRAVLITQKGRRGFADTFGIDLATG